MQPISVAQRQVHRRGPSARRLDPQFRNPASAMPPALGIANSGFPSPPSPIPGPYRD